MKQKLYFHEQPPEEQMRLLSGAMTWGEFLDAYQSPAWCNYPWALEGWNGCWSLLSQRVTSEAFCVGCECYVATVVS